MLQLVRRLNQTNSGSHTWGTHPAGRGSHNLTQLQTSRRSYPISKCVLQHTRTYTQSSALDRSTSTCSSFHLPIQPLSPLVHAFGDEIFGEPTRTDLNPTAYNLRPTIRRSPTNTKHVYILHQTPRHQLPAANFHIRVHSESKMRNSEQSGWWEPHVRNASSIGRGFSAFSTRRHNLEPDLSPICSHHANDWTGNNIVS